jgi:hypothetical protein
MLVEASSLVEPLLRFLKPLLTSSSHMVPMIFSLVVLWSLPRRRYRRGPRSLEPRGTRGEADAPWLLDNKAPACGW